jgi:hypothetical protein
MNGTEAQYGSDEDRQIQSDWQAEGCLPPNEAKERLLQLLPQIESDVAEGKIPESVRNLMGADTTYALSKKLIDEETHQKVLRALKVDKDGNPL